MVRSHEGYFCTYGGGSLHNYHLSISGAKGLLLWANTHTLHRPRRSQTQRLKRRRGNTGLQLTPLRGTFAPIAGVRLVCVLARFLALHTWGYGPGNGPQKRPRVKCFPGLACPHPRKHMLGADEPLQRSGTVTVGGQPHTVTDGRVKVLVGGKKELKRQGKHESLAELEQRLNRIVSMVSRSPSCCFAVAGRMPFRHRCMPALRRVAGRILRA